MVLQFQCTHHNGWRSTSTYHLPRSNHHVTTRHPTHCDTTENQCYQSGIYPVLTHNLPPPPPSRENTPKFLYCLYLSSLVVFLMCIFVNCIFLVCIFVILCVFVIQYVYCCFTLDAGLLARSQYPEGPATGHLDTGFPWFPCVYK